MSSAAASAEYAQDALDFAVDLDEEGYRASFGTREAGANDWDPPGEYVEVGKAAVFPSEWRADFSSDVRADDLIFFVASIMHVTVSEMIPLGEWRVGIDEFGGYREFLDPRTTDAPNLTHMIDSDGTQRSIVNVRQFKPDGISTIYYEIQTR